MYWRVPGSGVCPCWPTAYGVVSDSASFFFVVPLPSKTNVFTHRRKVLVCGSDVAVVCRRSRAMLSLSPVDALDAVGRLQATP